MAVLCDSVCIASVLCVVDEFINHLLSLRSQLELQDFAIDGTLTDSLNTEQWQ